MHDHARAALEPLLDSMDAAVVAFGSVVRSDFRPGVSDINLMVCLEKGSMDDLLSMGEDLRAAWRKHRVAPFLVRTDELPRICDSFPIRMLDIQRHHHVLKGSPPLEELSVEPEHLRVRVEQELRNRLLRTRRRIVLGGDDLATLESTVRGAAKTLRLELWALLVVCGHEPKQADRQSVLKAAREHLDLNTDVLDLLMTLQADTPLKDPAETLTSILMLLEAAVALADRAHS